MDLLNSRQYSIVTGPPFPVIKLHQSFAYLLAVGVGGSLSLEALISDGVFSLDL
jgi:hypothetical protein